MVSYWPQYRGVELPAVTGFTHLLYAFGEVDDTGGLLLSGDLSALLAMKTAARASGVRPGLLVGGWNNGDDRTITAAMTSPAGREKLARSIAAVLLEHQLSAVEIDWEYPDSSEEGKQLVFFLAELKRQLHARDISIGLSVPALGVHADIIPNAVFEHIDVLSVMAYDNVGGPHAGRDFFSDSLHYWLKRGARPSIIAMGLPAYSRPSPQTFSALVEENPLNAWRDTDGKSHWNGLPTIRWKVEKARSYGVGLMLWELGQDAEPPRSIVMEMMKEVGDGFSGER